MRSRSHHFGNRMGKSRRGVYVKDWKRIFALIEATRR